MEKIPAGGSFDEDEGREGAQGSTERICRRKGPDGRSQKEMFTYSGQRH